MIRGIFVLSGLEIWNMIEHSRSKFFSNHLAVDDLTKTFTMVPLQSSRMVPKGEGLSIDAIDPSMYTVQKG